MKSMIKKLNIKVLSFLSLLFIGVFVSNYAFAEEGSEFTISPIYGEGQTDKSLGYFSIKSDNEKKIPIKINIQNLNTSESSEFEILIVPSTTTNNGRISYTPNEQKKASNELIQLNDLFSKEDKYQKIKVEANKTKDITCNLIVPEEGIKGTVLGSIYVKKIPKEKKTSNGMGIKNVFAMTIPIVISQDFEKKVAPKLSLTNVKIKSDTGVPTIVGEVSNSAPAMFGEISINAWVTKKNKDQKLYEKESANYEMAPNSVFEYGIETDNHLLKSGRYTYHMIMKSGEKTFNLSKDFVVKDKEREQVNEHLLDSEAKDYKLWIIIGISIFLIIIISFIAYRSGQKRKG